MFENVTFVYNGTASFELSGNNIVGRFRIATNSPAVDATIKLLRGLGLLSKDFEFVLKPGSQIEPPIK
jgi:hypothetical protein